MDRGAAAAAKKEDSLIYKMMACIGRRKKKQALLERRSVLDRSRKYHKYLLNAPSSILCKPSFQSSNKNNKNNNFRTQTAMFEAKKVNLY